MTNLERIKTTLCNIINSMSEEELFEFLSDYDEIYEYVAEPEVEFSEIECRIMLNEKATEAFKDSGSAISWCFNKIDNKR